MSEHRIIAFVMAGGQGSRLYPLTAPRSKPAVPFGTRYRIVDFVLSNLINSKIFTVYLLVQYRSQSLIEHVRKAWQISHILPEQFVTVVPPQMRSGTEWFQGTADAVYQNLPLIEEHQPDLVVVFGADHIYRMDVRQMVDFHCERNADVTVSALPVPIDQASSFGIIAADTEGRVQGFQEKPVRPAAMPNDPARSYASMGNYLFSTAVLIEALQEARASKETDFGQHVLPRLLKDKRLFAYDFATNAIPGIRSYEEKAYWRDVGTIDAYFDAHRDVLGRQPGLEVFNPQWPIYSSNYQGPVAKIIRGDIENSLLGAASIVDGGRVINSIVRRESVIEPGAEVEDCIIMDYVHIGSGARLRRAIVDRHNVIEASTRIGYDLDADRDRYHVTESDIVVVPRGRATYYARDTRVAGPGYEE
jgi:glucose-1-phosphate adenylyltransferase